MSKLDRFAKGEIVLHTPTQEIYNKLMEWCDSQGIKWPNGKRASDLNVWDRHKELTCIEKGHTYSYYRSNDLEWAVKSYFRREGYKVETLSLADFKAKQKQNNFRVEIYFDGNDTHAWLIKNDEPVKEGIALCHPNDKFNMAVGSQLALERLFEKKQEKIKFKEVKRQAEVGDYIKIVDIGRHNPALKVGDIHLVEIRYADGDLGTNRRNLFSIHERHQYVVLENYDPKVHGNV